MDGRVLVVTVKEAYGLKSKRLLKKQDPYCVVECGKHRFRSKTDAGGHQAPTWDESFSFLYKGQETLTITIFIETPGQTDESLGYSSVDMRQVPLESGRVSLEVPVLRKAGEQQMGCIKLCLELADPADDDTFQVPTDPLTSNSTKRLWSGGRLTHSDTTAFGLDLYVQVLSATKLPAGDFNGLSDPYVVLRAGSGVKQQTKVVKETLNPVWNETFVFEHHDVVMACSQLTFEVWDWDEWTKDDLLGVAPFDLSQVPRVPGVRKDFDSIALSKSLTGGSSKRERGTLAVAMWWGHSRGSRHRWEAEGPDGPQSRAEPDEAHLFTLCAEGGMPKTLPYVLHTNYGTLYEEPNMVYVNFSLLQINGLPEPDEYAAPSSTGGAQRSRPSASGPSKPPIATTSLPLPLTRQSSSAKRTFRIVKHQSSLPDISSRDMSGAGLGEPQGSGGISLEQLRAPLSKQLHRSSASRTSTDAADTMDQLRHDLDVIGMDPSASGNLYVDVSAGNNATGSMDGGVGGDDGVFEDDMMLPPMSVGPGSPREGAGGDGGLEGVHSLVEAMPAAGGIKLYAYCRITINDRRHKSRMVRVRGGVATFKQCFLYALQRPLKKDCAVTLELWLTVSASSRGRVASTSQVSLFELLEGSSRLPNDFLSASKLQRFEVQDCCLIELQGMEATTAEVATHAVDADQRAQLYGASGSDCIVRRVNTPALSRSASLAVARALTPVARILPFAGNKGATSAADSAGDPPEPEPPASGKGPVISAAAASGGAPLGRLMMTIDRLQLSSKPVFCILQCGPHWVRTKTQVEVPVYHPSVTLSVAVFTDPGANRLSSILSSAQLISRTVIKMSKLATTRTCTETIPLEDTTNQYVGKGQLVLQLQLTYPSRAAWLKAYTQSPFPPLFFYTNIFSGTSPDEIQQEHSAAVTKWLQTCHPPISLQQSLKVLDNGRQTFAYTRALTNLARVQARFGWVQRCLQRWHEVQEWQKPWVNVMVLVIGWLLVFRTTEVVATSLLLWGGWSLWRRFCATVAQRAHQHHHAADASTIRRPAPAEVADDVDVQLNVPAKHALADLRQRYQKILGFALLAQSKLDDIACILERLQALTSWRDPLASGVFFAACMGGGLVVRALGLRWLMFGILLMMTRPPQLRSPTPAAPLAYICNLPSMSTDRL